MSYLKVAALTACMLCSGSALAQLFAAVGNIPPSEGEGALGPTDFMLYTIDPATGSILETIGNTGWPITGLDFHPKTGELYASSAYDSFEAIDMGDTEGGADINRGWLLKVDPETGAVTPIGQHEDCALVDISFAADGTLYGWRECNDILVTVDLATGATTEVGPDTSTARQGMDFAPDGRLYQFGDRPGYGQDCGVV